MLPEIIQSYTGFRGCILDIQIRPADQGIFLGPVKTLGGRNVGHCSRDAQEDKPCHFCLNGGTCNFYGSSLKLVTYCKPVYHLFQSYLTPIESCIDTMYLGFTLQVHLSCGILWVEVRETSGRSLVEAASALSSAIV
jgi:hypothetical protein